MTSRCTDHTYRIPVSCGQLWMGDLNVAVENIDIHDPIANRNKSPGFTDEERDNFRALLKDGWVDTYRKQYPLRAQYTYWGYRFGMRGKNKGAWSCEPICRQ